MSLAFFDDDADDLQNLGIAPPSGTPLLNEDGTPLLNEDGTPLLAE